jgi:hypothetical protein
MSCISSQSSFSITGSPPACTARSCRGAQYPPGPQTRACILGARGLQGAVELDNVEFVSVAEARIDHKRVTFLFLPEEAEALKKLMGEAELLFTGDESFVFAREHYDDVFALVADMKEHFEIVNNPTAMMKIVELARERIGEISKTMPPEEEQKQ